MNFSAIDCDKVFKGLLPTIKKEGRVTKDDVPGNLKGVFPNFADSELIDFVYSSIRNGKIPQFKISKGRTGGIRLNESYKVVDGVETETETEAEAESQVQEEALEVKSEPPVVETSKKVEVEHTDTNKDLKGYDILRLKPKAVVVEAAPKPYHLWVNDVHYQLDLSPGKLYSLITNVVELTPSETGEVLANDVRYTGTKAQLDLLEKFLYFFFSASVVTYVESASSKIA